MNQTEWIDFEEAAIYAKTNNTHTIWLWMRYGAVVGGERLKLRAKRIGRRWLTQKEWIDEFMGALMSGRMPRPLVAPDSRRKGGAS